MHYFAHQFFDGHHILENVRFCVEDNYIAKIEAAGSSQGAQVLQGLVAPLMVDVQVNGGGGVQFNDSPTLSALQQMSSAYLTTGTGSIMPTLITDDFDVMQAGADAIALAHREDPVAFPGVHFEGPHLSIAKKGMHSATFIRPISEREFSLFTRKDLGQVLLTVAPEMVSPTDINRLTSEGVIVSVGHTNAHASTCLAAFDAGATGVTHLFNAMSPLTSREPGVVGSALYKDDIYCGLIVDHQHVHPISASLAIKLKGDARLMLVTDAMAPAASSADHFIYQGSKVYRDGPTLKLEDGTLAGSVLTMDEALRHTHFDLNVPLLSVLKMATSTPASFLGLADKCGTLNVGLPANWMQLDSKLALQAVWKNGVRL